LGARSDRSVWLSNVEFRGARRVPCSVYISAAVLRSEAARLREIAARYPSVDSNVPAEGEEPDLGPTDRKDEPFTDSWGCVWRSLRDGITGQVIRSPLSDWDMLRDYQPPSPSTCGHLGPLDWEHERRLIDSARKQGALTRGAIAHGFFFQRLYYLRGFENLMVDIATQDPRLDELCEMVLSFNEGLVRRYLDIGVDVMHFGDDLGMQERLQISPVAWRRYVKPAYARLFGMCRRAGAHVYFHSDGYIVDIMPDLIECGVTILNPQDLCNGLDNIQRLLKGRVCIDLDIDRQSILPFGMPQDVDRHIERCVRTLGSTRGGLMMICGIYPGTPIENIEALFRAMERHGSLDGGEC